MWTSTLLTNSNISCEHYDSVNNRQHFLDYTPSKGAMDCDYLEALFNQDTEEIQRIESAASALGYGLLAQCNTVCNFSSQRIVCRKYRLLQHHL
jgi:hypothetical protein